MKCELTGSKEGPKNREMLTDSALPVYVTVPDQLVAYRIEACVMYQLHLQLAFIYYRGSGGIAEDKYVGSGARKMHNTDNFLSR
jgi:hypothetical protein